MWRSWSLFLPSLQLEQLTSCVCIGRQEMAERRCHGYAVCVTHFLGLWDTVSSVSWAWEPTGYPFTARNPSLRIVRHALSLDERRWFFREARAGTSRRSARSTGSTIRSGHPGSESGPGGANGAGDLPLRRAQAVRANEHDDAAYDRKGGDE